MAFPQLRNGVDLGILELDPPRLRIREAVEEIRPHVSTARARTVRTIPFPTDRTLQIARECLPAALPEATDTKWCIAGLFLRETVRASACEHPTVTGDSLNAAGQAFVRSAEPETGWTPLTILEECHWLTRMLSMEGTVRCQGNEIDIATTDCTFIKGADSPAALAICEAVCGERASVCHGVADAVGGRLESSGRMGDGHLSCIRSLHLPAHMRRAPIATPTAAAPTMAASAFSVRQP